MTKTDKEYYELCDRSREIAKKLNKLQAVCKNCQHSHEHNYFQCIECRKNVPKERIGSQGENLADYPVFKWDYWCGYFKSKYPPQHELISYIEDEYED